jgi:hypothetical protein
MGGGGANCRKGHDAASFRVVVLDLPGTASPPESNQANNQASSRVIFRPGHAGPPRLRASERTLEPSPDGRAALVVTEVSLDERSTLTVSIVEVKEKRPIPLLKGSPIDRTVLSRQRTMLTVDVARPQTLSMRLRLPLARLERVVSTEAPSMHATRKVRGQPVVVRFALSTSCG